MAHRFIPGVMYISQLYVGSNLEFIWRYVKPGDNTYTDRYLSKNLASLCSWLECVMAQIICENISDKIFDLTQGQEGQSPVPSDK